MAFKEIVIEDDVMFAANVFVSDGAHGTTTGETPYKFQGITGIAPIRIGRGSWIGQNAVIMPGVTIGELAVIGANSVVTKDVPARSVAVGAPARVVKRWDLTAQNWTRVEGSQ
ncbi:MAG TPA: acyltransferase [Trueperaceae bacterium]|nr:acyltransferase [Trueperaceae bacterium]